MVNTEKLVKFSDSKGKWLRRAAMIVLASALIAAAGPFGTSSMDIAPRFLYWLGGISIGWAQWSLIMRLLHRLTSANPWPPGVAGTVAAFFFAGLMALEIYVVRTWLIDAPSGTGTTAFLGILGAMLAYCWLGQLLVRLASGGSPAASTESEKESDSRTEVRFPQAHSPPHCRRFIVSQNRRSLFENPYQRRPGSDFILLERCAFGIGRSRRHASASLLLGGAQRGCESGEEGTKNDANLEQWSARTGERKFPAQRA